MTIGQLIENATKAFMSQCLPTPRLDAEVLLASCLKKDRTWLYIHSGHDMNATEVSGFLRWVARRQQGEPVAYIVGRKEFWSLDFAVDPRVLIPRPDTEVLVEEVLKALDISKASRPEILDLGTGSGAIAVALAHECPDARITATDISREALAVAAGNAERHRVASRITFLEGNLFNPVRGCFDVIVSNPPYIAAGDYAELSVEVLNFEPRGALLAGKEGTDFYQAIVPRAVCHLKPGGGLLLEIGDDQKELIEGLFRQSGAYQDVAFRKDYAGRWRVVKAMRKEEECG